MIRNRTRDVQIAKQAVRARSMFARMRGMLGRRFDDFDALIFERNNSIHMFFMRIPLDVLFLDKEDRVVAVRHTLKPWRMAAEWKSSTCVELPAGRLAATGTEVGDQLELAPVCDL